MSITFIDSQVPDNIRPRGRFPAPGPNAEFKFWKDAVPAPAYTVCIVRIVAIAASERVKIQFLSKTGDVLGLPVDIDVNDRDMVWPTFPSTIVTQRPTGSADPTLGPLPASVAGLQNNDCAVLCVTDDVLTQAGLTAPQVGFIKFPFTEDDLTATNQALAVENRLLRDAVRDLQKAVNDVAPGKINGIGSVMALHGHGIDI